MSPRFGRVSLKAGPPLVLERPVRLRVGWLLAFGAEYGAGRPALTSVAAGVVSVAAWTWGAAPVSALPVSTAAVFVSPALARSLLTDSCTEILPIVISSRAPTMLLV